MLFFDFKNYEEFNEIFGIVEHGNGVKSRKNKILLALYKDRGALRAHIRAKETASYFEQVSHWRQREDSAEVDNNRKTAVFSYEMACRLHDRRDRYCSKAEAAADMLECKSLPVLKKRLMQILSDRTMSKPDTCFRLWLNGYTFPSDLYETDDMEGLCEDGTLNAIRYRNVEKERVYKMKAGRMFNHIMSCNVVVDAMPEQIKRWLSEEFVADWIEFARQNIGDTEYTLHVDDNFCDIYTKDRCAGYDTNSDSFGSCMMDDEQWEFYEKSVNASAAYLTGPDGLIYARCIVFNDVTDEDGRKWRLAERQYSKFGELDLQRMLVSALIRGGHIDGYKRVGASCHDSRAFLDNEGNSLEDKCFSIACRLESGDTLSYQDSFKYYDYNAGTADNYGSGSERLDTTESEFEMEERCWSDYNNEDIPEGEAVYVETRGDYFWTSQTVTANVYSHGRYYEEACYEDDCIDIDGDYYYAGRYAENPEDYGICKCPVCGDYFVCEDGCYSDVTEEDYCCDDCMGSAEKDWYETNGWVQASWDDMWYEGDRVITALAYTTDGYTEYTIDIETFNALVGRNEATEYCGTYYIDDLLIDGQPAHLHLAEKIVA